MQQVELDDGTTYEELVDRVLALFSINQDFLRAIHLEIVLEFWNPTTSQIQTINQNITELYSISTPIIMSIVDSNE